MLYERWHNIATARRNETALHNLATGQRWTFGQLMAEAEALAPPAQRIVCPEGHSPEFIVCLLSAWRAGKMVCPLEPGQAACGISGLAQALRASEADLRHDRAARLGRIHRRTTRRRRRTNCDGDGACGPNGRTLASFPWPIPTDFPIWRCRSCFTGFRWFWRPRPCRKSFAAPRNRCPPSRFRPCRRCGGPGTKPAASRQMCAWPFPPERPCH